jgi:hypothetical protein
MLGVLDKKKLTVSDFKKQYPLLYNKIIKTYSGPVKIFDPGAAIELWYRKEPPPQCELCKQPLAITKKFRSADVQYRCAKHSNVTNVVTVADLVNVLSDTTKIVSDLPEKFSPATKVRLECSVHGEYTQLASYILQGGKCQKCYHESRVPRITKDCWIERCTTVHDGFYDYSKSVFTGIANKVTITCPKHGEFVQAAGVHYRGHGCPKCGIASVTNKLRITNEEFIEKCKTKHKNLYSYNKTKYVSILHGKIIITCHKHGDFIQRPGDHLNGGHGCPKCGAEMSTFKSKAEYEIIDFLKANGISNIIHSDQSLGFEIDILIPDYCLAIEYNGVYWHSSSEKATDAKLSKQHLHKTEECEKNGISLLHILDIEWNDPIKQEIWKSCILHKLGLSKERIYARKCGIVLVSRNRAISFFNENHLQGSAASSINIGLQYNGRLVAVGSFASARFNKTKNTYELIRFASLKNTSIIGGFRKIIKEFSRTHGGNLISYANRRWSQGNVYKTTGFELASVSGPCYYYTDCKTLWHRTIFQKHKLKDILPNFDPVLTEIDNMYNNKYRRIWDCGHFVYKIDLGQL